MQVIQDIRKQLPNWLADEFRPSVLVSSLLSALLIYIFALIVILSFAALIFSGELASQLPQVLGYILIGDAVLIGTTTLLSSYPGSVGSAQDAPTAILGVISMQIVAALPAASAAQNYATVVMIIIITTVSTGLLFLALGVFKLGGLARYLPYPVMGGFLAGTGWLLTKGGVEIMIDIPFGSVWFDPQNILRWLPGTLLGVLILVSASRIRQPLVLPVMLAAGILIFYLAVIMFDIPIAMLDAEGWLVGSLPSGGMGRFPLSSEILSQVNWRVLLGQIPNMASAAIISVVALLLISGGLELVIKKDINLNRELVAAGIGNLAAGAFGGLAGYQAVSFAILNHKISGGKRLVGLVVAFLMGVSILLGTSALRYMPKMILGAALVYLGAALLVEWVYESWFKFTKIDFVIILSILIVIALGSFLNGIIFGLVLAIIMFAISYSNVSIIKHELSGNEYHSRVTRSLKERQLLEKYADQMYILKLQGFIFFGTANSIFVHVREWFSRQPGNKVCFILLDFSQVTGLDSTGLLSFKRMLQWCEEQEIALVLTGLGQRVHQQLARGGFFEQPESVQIYNDLDHGVEWCENEIVSEFSIGKPDISELSIELKAIAGEHHVVERLLPYMHRCEFETGDYLIRQDDEPDMIYFIESGQVTAQLEVPDQPPVRLETMGGGRTVGELGFYLDINRTAAVIVDEPSVIYSLSKQELANMEKTDPEAANLFHRIIVHLLGERVVHLIRTVNALER